MDSTDDPAGRILIAGASARAAVHSALRAGWSVIAADQFGDVDLRSVADWHLIEDYRRDLPSILEQTAPDGFFYTGALENYPDVLEHVELRTTVLGNSSTAVRLIRDPFHWTRILSDHDISVLRVVHPEQLRAGDDGTWLMKPLQGGGGLGIRTWPATPRPNVFLQQRVSGVPASAVFLSSMAEVRVIGVTLQLTGFKSLGASTFGYCGSIGPISLSELVTENIARIASVATNECGLLGLNGVDLMLDRESSWPIEFNPRYTASIEVLEHAYGVDLLAEHLRVFGRCAESACQPPSSKPDQTLPIAGKVIVYAQESLTVPDLTEILPVVDGAMPGLADIPPVGSHIREGDPVCTVLDRGNSVLDCVSNLDSVLTNSLGDSSDARVVSMPSFVSEIRTAFTNPNP